MPRTPAQTGAERASGPSPARRDDPGAEILERFPLAMYSVGVDGVTGHLSPALQRVLGIPQESSDWHLSNLPELVHPDDRDRVLHELSAGRETLEPFRMDYRLRRHDGAYVWVVDEAVFIRDAHGDTIREGFLVDITERMQAIEDLRVSEERFRTLLSNIPGAMYRCDLNSDWDMEFISDNIEAISGFPASDFAAGGNEPISRRASDTGDRSPRCWCFTAASASRSALAPNAFSALATASSSAAWASRLACFGS